MENLNKVVRLDVNDNVVIACSEIGSGTLLQSEGITTNKDIAFGHKIATKDIKKGNEIKKYNTVIGYASDDILAGDHVHNHNVLFEAKEKKYDFCSLYEETQLLPQSNRLTFMGYVRSNGSVGTRNFIAVPVVSNCAATVARKVAQYFTEEKLSKYPNVHGVVPLITTLGCGMEKAGSLAMTYLRRIIAGHIDNPNIAGSVVCAIGCENNNIDDFFSAYGYSENDLLKKIVIQEEGGTKSSIQKAIGYIEKMLPIVNDIKREPCSIEHLKIGLQCGGSDSFSSISANPALGKAMDMLIKNGGTACLSETTEIFSTEHTLVARAKNKEIGQKLLSIMDWWLEYAKGCDIQINGKVTPGNNAGGLTNILEKALGSVKKAGNTALNGIFEYGEKITENGFVIMDTPSYDPVSATAQFAGQCNVCVFTTGRGSCYGSIYFPTIKIASNSELYEKLSDDMDVNAGTIIEGTASLEQVGEEILKKIIDVASGAQTKSEILGVGEDEYIPWDVSVTG